MKTISKNARMSLTALVFGASLITGVEANPKVDLSFHIFMAGVAGVMAIPVVGATYVGYKGYNYVASNILGSKETRKKLSEAYNNCSDQNVKFSDGNRYPEVRKESCNRFFKTLGDLSNRKEVIRQINETHNAVGLASLEEAGRDANRTSETAAEFKARNALKDAEKTATKLGFGDLVKDESREDRMRYAELEYHAKNGTLTGDKIEEKKSYFSIPSFSWFRKA